MCSLSIVFFSVSTDVAIIVIRHHAITFAAAAFVSRLWNNVNCQIASKCLTDKLAEWYLSRTPLLKVFERGLTLLAHEIFRCFTEIELVICIVHTSCDQPQPNCTHCTKMQMC